MQREISTPQPQQVPSIGELGMNPSLAKNASPKSIGVPFPATMVPDGLYPMRAVVQLTGLKAETIRAWQRRYGAVVPRRSQGNARRFTMEDVRRLALLKEAISVGHAISEIARLDEEQLLQIVQKKSSIIVEDTASNKSLNDKKVFDHTIHRFLMAVEKYNSAEASNILSNASIYLETRSFLLHIIVPLMRKIGTLWSEGEIGVGQEHLATEVVKGTLYTLRKNLGFHADGPKVLIATPPSCIYEFGATIAGILATQQGWQPVFLGPNIPFEEMQEAAQCIQPQVILLAIQTIISSDHLEEIEQGITLLTPDATVWAGGPAHLMERIQCDHSVKKITSLESLHVEFEVGRE